MRIQHAMSSPAVTVPATASVQDAAQHMRRSGAGAVFVVADDNRLLGVVTDRDLVVRVLARGMSARLRVDTVMTERPVAVDAGDDIMSAYRAMRAQRVLHLPVVSAGRLVGVVTFDELFRLSMRGLADPQGEEDSLWGLVAPFRGT
ncbi:cyclic nucleotide-binding/CBS domain-containing protein [Streptomyces spectabilis]|uniref:CBS domain-containing protein n=1 Tax=Streptomyces spectabilis TaxID=68270 RepID=A0A516R1B2_STRST|nr:CBS domain-containing protein [Streptomyces spectabilis]QDQ09443.1 CBS domain-containing protein [Streptomyces spectabilis]